MSDFGRLADTILSRYARRVQKRRWVDKTPNYYRILPLIDAMFRGRCLYLFIIRHPLDTVDSLAHYFADADPEDPDIARVVKEYGGNNHAWAQYWVDVNQRIAAFRSGHCDRSLVFRYEDLLAAPAQTMSEVFAFIGETLPSDLFDVAFTMPHPTGYEDWKIRRTTRLHSDSIAKWESWPRNEIVDLWQVVGSTAEAFGYTCPHLHRDGSEEGTMQRSVTIPIV